jgi:hypothetical protein
LCLAFGPGIAKKQPYVENICPSFEIELRNDSDDLLTVKTDIVVEITGPDGTVLEGVRKYFFAFFLIRFNR